MPHPRKTIRHETASRLPGLFEDDAFANRVHRGRYLPLDEDNFERAICVYTLRNDARREGAQTQPTFRDTCSLAIEIFLRGLGEDVEDLMDDVIDVIEHRLIGDQTWRKACGIEQVDGIATQYKIEAKGAAPYIGAQLAIDLQYRTTFPPLGLVPLKGFSIAVKPIEPRDPNLDFPPANWRLTPFAKFDVEHDD